MAVSKQPTITPETSSGEGLDEEPSSRGEAKWKRFHPFRVVRKIFRRRIKREGTNVVSDSSKKSWSTSELQSVQDDTTGKCEVTSPLKIGLSVSHDSIFSPENNANVANNESLDVPHCSSLSVRHTSMKNMFKDELFTRIRARRDSDDDDGIGMQSSPYSSPTTMDVLNQGFKEKLPKSQTTCSAGSLISMGSSENDEDSTGQSSGHSSRMSLIDRRSLDSEADSEATNPVPLNHNAAHHKIAVRPKRTHGLPRRRVKQVAASKVTSLPSTPEVTEDPNKNMQFEISEKSKSAHEHSVISEKSVISTSASSMEKQITTHSTTSYSEVYQYSSETHYLKEKTLSESTSYAKIHDEEDDVWVRAQSDMEEEMNVSNDDSAIPSIESHEDSTSEITFEDSKESLTSRNEDSEIESYKLVKNALQEKPVCDTILDDYVTTSSESPISVSSLVRNIEKSDSFRNPEKNRKSTDELKHYEKFSEHSESFDRKPNKEPEDPNLKIVEESQISLQGFQNGVQEISESINLISPQGLKLTSVDCLNETIKKSPVSEKLDIDSEFVLKPLKKERKFSGENDSVHAEVVSENKKDSSLVSSVYLEEESIMSNKSLSVGMEESRIVVSHHASSSDDVKDILVTEAHNVNVEEKSEISIQHGEDAISTRRKVTEPYVSSVGITSSMHSGVIYTSSSTLCDKRISEDKITISVNSSSCNAKSNSVSIQNNDRISPTSLQKRSPTPAENDSNQKIAEKQFKSSQKSHLPDVGSNTAIGKNANSQKRVSVEIVPFSQRMKERKYQPISFTNKECSSENKKNSSAQVERKLSDRKITKNKEPEKPNNRHSFSGTYNSDSKKDTDLITSKKETATKTEKVNYPVQIRIHKSKPEIKDKNSVTTNTYSELKDTNKDEMKINMNSIQSSHNDIKHLKDENKILENMPKWEIKIQPATPLHAPTSQNSSSEENSPAVLSQRNFVLKNESHKSSQFTVNENRDNSTDSEISMTKHLDSNWKSPKETPAVSDDPEPELLRVFARRSIKQKHCDKDKDEIEKPSCISPNDLTPRESTDKNNDMISVSLNSTVIKISEISKPHITKPDLKKKSKSFCEKEKVVPRAVSPLKEMNLIQRDSPARSSVDSLITNENLHPRQRIANVDDIPHTLPPESEKKIGNKNAQSESSVENSHALKEEHLHKPCSITTPPPSTSVNGSFSSIGMVKENQEMSGKDAHTPAWLQLAQQRRELREQRERLLLGGSPNSFMEASSKPSRSSKVWDMVNNFQKLQMT